MAALANVLVGFPYPKSDFAASWKKVLLMQFHDSMAGTALPEQYVVAHNAYGFAQEVANQAIYRPRQKIAWQIPTTDPDSRIPGGFQSPRLGGEAERSIRFGLGIRRPAQSPNQLAPGR